MLDFTRLPRFARESVRILDLIPQWARAYDADEKDVIRQIPIAHAWLVSNKAKYRDMTLYLNNWMRKANEYGNLKQAIKGRTYEEKKPREDEIMSGDDWAAIRRCLPPRKTKDVIMGEVVKE